MVAGRADARPKRGRGVVLPYAVPSSKIDWRLIA